MYSAYIETVAMLFAIISLLFFAIKVWYGMIESDEASYHPIYDDPPSKNQEIVHSCVFFVVERLQIKKIPNRVLFTVAMLSIAIFFVV